METLVYIADVSVLKDEVVFADLLTAVPGYRQKKVASYRFDKDKRLSLGAGLLLKIALEAYGISEDSTAFGLHGKPFLAGTPSVHYSLSHSGDMVMCAISELEIGCDIEQEDPSFLSLSEKVLAPAEKIQLNALVSPEKKAELFSRIWVLKESLLKATGEGLYANPRKYSFSLDGKPVLEGSSGFFFREIKCPNGYRAAICTLGSSVNPNVRAVNLAEQAGKAVFPEA